MNRSIKDATVKTHHYDDLESLKAQVLAFVTAHNLSYGGQHIHSLRRRCASASSAAAEEAWFAPPDNLDRGPRTFNDDFPQQ